MKRLVTKAAAIGANNAITSGALSLLERGDAGQGEFLLEGQSIPMSAGLMLIAPQGIPHGIHNTGSERLVVLAILAPGPPPA